MKYALRAGVALIALGFGGHAMAACPQDIGKLRTDLQKNESFQQRYTAGNIDRGSYRRLFDAAQTFSDTGLEKRCQEVLAGIRDLSEKAEARQPDAQTDRREPRSADRAPPATPRPNDREAELNKRLRAAQPIAAVDVSFENLVGSDVRNMRNDDLGDVEDFVMARGQVASVVIARGGFLGMGVNYHMVPAAQVKVANLDDDHSNKKSRVLVLDLTDEQAKALPRVTKKNGAWTQAADSDRRATPPDRSPSAPPSTPNDRPRQ